MLKTLYIETWGCQMNEYDSRKMANLLAKSHQLTLVKDPDLADVLLLNTCSIREKAEEKVFSLLGSWKHMKQSRPHVLIGVGGCVASQEGEKIFKRSPWVDFVFGPQTLQKLPAFITEALYGKKNLIDISFVPEEKFDQLPEPRADGPTAFVTIQEGCSKFCKYCIVPFTRGEEVNRRFDDIIKEVHKLEKQGVREITLLGQNVNAYRGITPTGEIADLATLIYYISLMNGIGRIRFTTSHPVEFNQTLVDAYANIPKLVSHLHLPVQSGSNRVLSAMARGHTREEYLEKINQLKKARPDLTITSDFIVGFPGETEEDFLDTLKLVTEVDFDQSFSFIYSKRPGTAAAHLECSLTLDEKKHRLLRLQDLLKKQTIEHQERMLDKTFTVLVAGLSKDGNSYYGRTENNRIVHLSNGRNELIGRFVEAYITKVNANSLIGRVVRLNDPYLRYEEFNSNEQEDVVCL